MPSFKRWLIRLLFTGMAIWAMVPPPGYAHSLKDLDSRLHKREKYFQPLDKEAPDFTLQDADGGTVALSDFRGKVVVLHFVYTNCPDVCPLHAERIAEVQMMVNQTPMRDLVEKFGHKFTEVEGGYQVHSLVTHVIDREGRWRANFHGLKFQSINLVLFINALTNDIH